ncbi:MAG: tetratricopeptide repeat protein, partial [Deltaproteobacteria bacterium]|nr:tetratricopeptide repeat protein [Deltaproteobacteria bacterium]
AAGGIDRLRLRARCRAALGEAAAAVAEARAAATARPDDPLPQVELALALVALQPTRVDEAVRPLGRAAALRPERGEYPYLQGTLLLDDERVAQARPLLERAVALDGRRAAPRLALAQLLIDAGEAPRAREVLAPVPELEISADEVERGRKLSAGAAGLFRGLPPDVRAAYRRAAGLLDEELPGQAVSAAEDLVRSRPGFAAAHTLLALAHLKLGNDARAFAALQRAGELNPDDPTNHLYLGLIYLDRDRVPQAARHLERALWLDPFNLRATASLARVREDAREWREAVRLYTRLCALDGGEGATWRALARALTAAGDQAGAERALLRALDREPSSYETNLMLGEVYQARFVELRAGEARGYAERARRHLRRALELRPGDEAARRALERLKP